jgi:L-threonylcarbamoyladenylate synthase
VSETHQVDPSRTEAARGAIRAAAAAIEASLLVVFPTETVYGLAARPDDPGATTRVFEAKRRPVGLSLPVLAGSADQALSLAESTQAAVVLAARFWPGPLTLVLPRSRRSSSWYLGGREETIGIRVPDDPISLALLRVTGPLAATSANISGRPPLLDPASLIEAFGDSVAVYLTLPAGAPPPGQRSSTVVDLTGPAPRVSREGPIGGEELRIALGGVQTESTG